MGRTYLGYVWLGCTLIRAGWLRPLLDFVIVEWVLLGRKVDQIGRDLLLLVVELLARCQFIIQLFRLAGLSFLMAVIYGLCAVRSFMGIRLGVGGEL